MKTATPFFTVIITTHNRPQLLLRAVESVTQQTLEDWELIIVDDGSTLPMDKAWENTAYAPRIAYRVQENKGVSAARNVGIALAQGQYLCFLDDDDYYLHNHLAVHFDKIQQTGQQFSVYRSLAEFHTSLGKILRRTEFKEPFWEEIWRRGDNLHPYVFRKEVFDKVLFDEEVFRSEDALFLLECLLQHTCTIIPTVTVVYHMYPQGKSQSLHPLQIQRAVFAQQRYKEKLDAIMTQRLGPSHYKYPLMRLYLGYFYKALERGKPKLALEMLCKALPYTQLSTLKHLLYLPMGIYKVLT